MGADQIGYLLEIPRKLPKSAFKRAVRVVTATRRFDGTRDDEENTEELLPLRQEAEVIVQGLVDQWYVQGRDLATRQSPSRPKTHLLIFCGGMSWGDEPDGVSYLYFKELDERGLFDAFGIR